jgi:metal-responsive CopG/Arc/MetJ family transcriptional regulator
MEIIQVVLDTKLLQATDRAAHRTKRNRSALIRDALREHLRRLEIRALEERDRDGYANEPQMHAEALVWEAEAAWPAE